MAKPEVLVLVCLLLSATVRVEASIDHKEWRFDTAANPSAPDVGDDSGSIAVVVVGLYGIGWYPGHYVLGTRQGLWDLGKSGTITLELARPPEPLEPDKLTLSIVYFRELYAPPIVDVLCGELSGDVIVEEIEEAPLGGAWYRELSTWTLSDSVPPTIILTADERWASLVDEVAVEIELAESLAEDANRDGIVNILDLLFVRNRLGLDPNTGDNASADVNGDGAINILDLICVRNGITAKSGQ